MKKKIKDLTRNETYLLCINTKTACINCPLSASGVCLRPYIPHKNEIEKMMEKEIEIEVEE